MGECLPNNWLTHPRMWRKVWHMNTQAPKFQEHPTKDCTLNMRMTSEQYQKLRRLGGAAWVRAQITKAKESSKSEKNSLEGISKDLSFLDHLRVPTVRMPK